MRGRPRTKPRLECAPDANPHIGMLEGKKCRMCEQTKTFDNFCKSKAKKDGFNVYCKQCVSEGQKNLRKENPQAAREKDRVSRERYSDKIHDYYEKWYAENGRERSDTYQDDADEYRKLHLKRYVMYQQIAVRIKSGEIIPPDKCSKCGREKKLHAHHYNYEHFMNFIWLCASCHKKEHVLLNRVYCAAKLEIDIEKGE